MSFITTHFALFFLVLFILYWSVRRLGPGIQNPLLLIASYYFYGYWDWRFLLLLSGISICNYLLGRAMSAYPENRPKRKLILIAGLVLNIGNLVVFKYFNFFVDEFASLLSLFGVTIQTFSLKWIIPLGISFYTFLSVSYLMDVYRKTIDAERNPLNVMLTLGFFPIILSGPIQRPALLLPQIRDERVFHYADMVAGLKQILWGLFTKVVIADNLAPVVSTIFSKPEDQTGATVLTGILFFTVQVYADFSGYSDMAIGFSKLLGFKIMRNFEYPYFSKNIAEFWRRWHISLTTWFRDYLFLPIVYAVSKRIRAEKVGFIKSDYLIYAIGISITWFVTGFWHGANTTFLIWGLIHGTALIIYQIQKKSRKKFFKFMEIRHDSGTVIWTEWVITMAIVMFSLLFFRADTSGNAWMMAGKLFSFSVIEFPDQVHAEFLNFCLITLFFIIEWIGRNSQFAIEKTANRWPLIFRWSFYALLISFVFLFAQTKSSSFLYFQF